MAVIFLEQRKKMLIMGGISFLFIGLALFILKGGFLSAVKPSTLIRTEVKVPPLIQIDFSFLEKKSFKDLQSLDEVPSLQETLGRDNPFLGAKAVLLPAPKTNENKKGSQNTR